MKITLMLAALFTFTATAPAAGKPGKKRTAKTRTNRRRKTKNLPGVFHHWNLQVEKEQD